MSKSYHRYAISVLVMTILLIWWGAATTTKQAGMAFSDWPLSFGSINPDGWLHYMAPFLEHSHRLIATVVGLMTLILFGWSFVKRPLNVVELIGLTLVLAFVFALFIVGGAETQSAARKARFFEYGLMASLVPVGWLVYSWARRGWPLVTKLSALALLMVTAQAIMGGIRVTEISDSWAVVHGCFAQSFFCVVLLIAMKSGPQRELRLGGGSLTLAQRAFPIVMTASVVTQLILGALMRHHHRSGLADTGIFKTDGHWLPNLHAADPILAIMFFHKYWAWVVFLVALSMFVTLKSIPAVKRLSLSVVLLLVVQIALGISVILTGKHFWLTNFHVLNGLAILAISFATAARVTSLRAREKSANFP